MLTQLDTEAFWTGVIWCVLGLIIFFICQAKYGKKGDEDLAAQITEFVQPPAEEKAKMDQEFKVWAVIVAVAVVVAIGLYVVPFIFV